jgi:flagellar protein FlgJ
MPAEAGTIPHTPTLNTRRQEGRKHMGHWSLAGPVGIGQPNARRDVLTVQKLLNRSRNDDPRGVPLAEDGIFGVKTVARLEEFQVQNAHFAYADGVVQPGGPTSRTLGIAPPATGFSSGSALASLAAQRARPGGGGAPASGTPPVVQPGSQLAALMQLKAAQPKSPLKRSWVNRCLPAAVAVKAKWGVPIAVTLAQGALESHWGTQAPGNAFFGIKAHGAARAVTFQTHEESGGKMHTENDAFRAYASIGEAADDYGRFLTENKRYARAFLYKNDPDRFVHEVAAAGYATASGYEFPIKSIMAFNGFKEFDAQHPPLVYNDAVSIGNFA